MKNAKYRMLEDILVVKTPNRFPDEELTSFGNAIKKHMDFKKKARKGWNPVKDVFTHILFRLGISDRDCTMMDEDENLPEILLKCDIYDVKYEDCEKFVDRWIRKMVNVGLQSYFFN